jgi:hypothetical protein
MAPPSVIIYCGLCSAGTVEAPCARHRKDEERFIPYATSHPDIGPQASPPLRKACVVYHLP